MPELRKFNTDFELTNFNAIAMSSTSDPFFEMFYTMETFIKEKMSIFIVFFTNLNKENVFHTIFFFENDRFCAD